jgi:class 3 adenylate cyclase
MPSSIKHELGTPLNHIIGYCELLMEEAHDGSLEFVLPDLERIHGAGKRLQMVIHGIFDPVKSEEYVNEPSRLDHEIRTPLNQIIGYAEMLEEKSRELGHEVLVADLHRIHTAARELLERVVRHLVSSGGSTTLSAAPPDNRATTFIRKEDSAAGVTRGGAFRSSAALTGTLLVVDDDEANLTMLARRLVRLGHDVVMAESGRQALEKLRAGSFDLMLLDIQMPEMSGYQVLEQVKADPALRTVPVIVLSASSETDRVAHCVELGAEDYLPKPFDPVLLQARINACLEQKRLRDREVTHLRQIEEARQRSDDLLRVILPDNVAEELKNTNAVKPRRFEKVGVLFCDIVGFTAWCDQHTPEEVLSNLQELVETFERLTTEHTLEKIKTIGDSFMATAGLLKPLPQPALSAVRCGLAMVVAAQSLPARWQIRVGVHSGPVIAGVIGRRKYQYDVWGDTVNTASRMEQAAAPGTLCVNATTWEELGPSCRGQSLGNVTIKGKGDQELFRVTAV